MTTTPSTLVADNGERGFSLIEVLVICSLFAIIGLSIASSDMMMSYSRGRLYHNSLASQLVIQTLESFAGLDPATLSDSNDSSANVVLEGVTFFRTVDVTALADGSRQISVAITCPACRFGGSASLANNFPAWGST